MSLLTFSVIGLVCALSVRVVLPRVRALDLRTAFGTGVAGSLSAGLLAAGLGHEGSWREVFPTGLIFSVIGGVTSLLWLDALIARRPPTGAPR